MLRLTTIMITVAVTAAISAMLTVLAPSAPEALTPIERINQGFDAATSRPLQHYSTARKGDMITPTPVKTLDCTKQFCEPHRKGLDHLTPFERRAR